MLPVRGVARQLVLKLGAALAELDWRRVVGEADGLAALALLAVLLDDEDGGRVEAHWRVDDVAGDVVAVLESMKMEIEISAPESGQVVAINRQEGQQINAGQAIMVLD